MTASLAELWSIPFLLGFGCGMIASMIAALTFVGSIAANVTRTLTEIKAVVGAHMVESARTGDSKSV